MNKKTVQTFLIITIIFLLVSLSAVTATENNETSTTKNTQHTIEKTSTQVSTHNQTADKQPKEMVKTRNINQKTDDEKIDTTLTLKFINNPEDEISTEDYLFTHKDQQYKLDITLTEDKTNTPLSTTIQLYLLDETTPIPITLPHSGHTQTTQSIDKIGEQLTIYAQYEGNQQYNPTESQILLVDSEQYQTKLTLNEIENQEINSTITITGNLTYNENTPIDNAQLTISINNQEIKTTTTDNKGQYTENIKLENLEAQNQVCLTIEYNSPDEKYADADNECYFDIEKITNTITLNPITNAVVATPIEITGTLTNKNENTYKDNLTLIIKDNTDKIIYTNNSMEVKEGQYNTTFTPTKAISYQIIIQAPENNNFHEQTLTDTVNVEIATIYLEIEDSYESLVQENVSITGRIINENDDPMENISITISTDIDTLGTTTTNKKGEFNFTQYKFNSIPDDDFIKIYFEVEETEDHDNIYMDATYYISRRNVNVTLSAEEHLKINQTLHLEGNVKDSYNSSVPEGTMTIKINNQTVLTDIPLNNNGEYNADIILTNNYLQYAKLNVEAFFIPENTDVYYSENYDNITVILDTIQTQIEIISYDTSVNESVNITVNLKDEYDNKLNATITLVIRENNTNVYYEELELENGTKTITFNPTHEGIYHIIAQYAGLENVYQSSDNEFDFTASKTSTKININTINEIQYVNDTITISGQLKDINNNTIDNKQVLIEIINSTDIKSTSITTNNGLFTTQFRATKTDNITIRAIFEETQEYYGNYTQTMIQIVKHNTTISINQLPENIKYTDTITISGKVLTTENENANGSVKILINNELYTTINLDEGIYQETVNINEVGNDNSITVIFNENEAYNTSQTTTYFNVIPLETTLTLNPVNNTIVNSSLVLSGTLNDEKNNNLSGRLIIKINDELISENIPVENGIFNLSYIPSKIGNYTVNITYNADNQHYYSTSTNSTFNVIRAELEIINITSKVDEKEKIISISATLTSQANITTSSIPVTVSIGDKEYNTTSLENGTFTIESEKLYPGEYDIEIKVNQTEYFNPKNQSIESITIPKDNVNIILDEIINVTFSEEYNITGKLIDDYERPYNNTEVILTIANKTYTTTTDEEGKFNITISEFNAGLNNLTITVPETSINNKQEYNTSFNVEKEDTTIILEENNRILPHEDFIIRGHLIDRNNNKLYNQTVTILVNNKKYTSVTDNNGQFNITIKKAKLGTYNVSATFNNPNYNTVTANKSITVSKLNVNLVVNDVVAIVGDKITLRATITDEYGQKVSGGNLVFKLNGRTLRMDDRFDTDIPEVHKFNVKNGIVEYTINADLYLRHGKNISASYSGSYLYESAKSNIANASIQLRTAQINVTTVTTAKQHENITFKAQISDSIYNNTELIDKDAFVIFKVNNVTLKDENDNVIRVPVVNASAEYTYNVGIKSATDNDLNSINYTVTAIYDSPYYYPNVRNTTTFNVEKSLVNINISEVVVNDTTLHIKANLTDYLGCNLQGNNKVCIKINGVTYEQYNITRYYSITDGVLDIDDICVENISVHNVEIVTGERQAYQGARVKTNDIKVET